MEKCRGNAQVVVAGVQVGGAGAGRGVDTGVALTSALEEG